MIRPANGKQYDSFIWGQYFATVVNGAAAADEVTLAAIAAIDALPETVSLEDKALVLAAREAYNKISTLEQRALVTNYAKLEKAEKRIQDLEYLESGDNTDTPDDGENNGGFFESLPTSTWIAVGVAAGLLVVTVVFATLTVVFACLYIGKKNAPKKAAKKAAKLAAKLEKETAKAAAKAEKLAKKAAEAEAVEEDESPEAEEETPAEEASAEETPAEETPAEETPDDPAAESGDADPQA
jgi:hypothetical protein